ncbi:Peroxisomal biogenesis factor 6 [Erysiphe neolycopersici]|uniref:Peroxisomal ATPase PEX6 n=1 Tax=Erysiphe neolycopersici TaxID=212602 RepID=A0A420HW58_9PEZI|nr:Peroxisomal biogenesis factor 6 [Erysiphe neolycopersici]
MRQSGSLMNMENSTGQRRQRRRRQNKAALKARLVLQEHEIENVGLLSQDLFTECFSAISKGEEKELLLDSQKYLNIAVASSESGNFTELAHWTVVSVRPSSILPNNTLQLSPNSLAFQNFAQSLIPICLGHQRGNIGILISDVLPLELEVIYVTVDRDSARKLENGEGIIHPVQTKSTSCTTPLAAAIRQALSGLTIVRTGDYFNLPLQPHPITHLSSSPAKVILCEPVAQGLLSSHTKIIVTRTKKGSENPIYNKSVHIEPILKSYKEEEDDTSNDQFYSATEDRNKIGKGSGDETSLTEAETEATSTDDDLLDDPIEDMISLQVPQLSAIQTMSGNTTIQPATPTTLKGGLKNDGISTPGSIFSTLTTRMGYGGYTKRCLFKTQVLLYPICDEIIYPKPNILDDDEARVFVDIHSLTKIGCFSGDWVRLETASEPGNGTSPWLFGRCGDLESDEELWRPVKAFGLPEGYSRRSIIKIPSSKCENRRSSFFESQVQRSPGPIVYLSPILLANMNNTPFCRISNLKQNLYPGKHTHYKITGKSRPHTVRDLGLVKISTPFSTERYLQNALFSGLQRHFSGKTRVVRQGDIVAIGIDENLARTLYQPAKNDDMETDDNFTCAFSDSLGLSRPNKPTGVAWFRVKYVGGIREESDEIKEDDNIWGGVVSVDASLTRISQSGSENCRVPGTLVNSWEYYLGLKSISRADSNYNKIPEYKCPPVSMLQRRLRELIAAATSPLAIHFNSKPLAILVYSSQRNIGKSTVVQRAFADIGLHCLAINAYDIISEEGAGSDLKMAGVFEARAERAIACGSEYCGLLIRHIELFSTDRMISSLNKILDGLRVLIATTTDIDKVPKRIRGLFTHEIEMTAPDEGERESILRDIINTQAVPLAPNVDLTSIAIKTAALVGGDLVDVVDRALVARMKRLEKLASQASDFDREVTVRDILVSGGSSTKFINKVDFDVAVDTARKNFADAIGAPKIPNVSWNDVGGLTHVKDIVIETIQLPLERPELFTKGMKKRSGILFYGPPGTGKTLLAKAIATEFSLNFFSVKGPELLNMYIGESEANVRRVFQRARDARPCVVFFDELDSVAPKRGNQGDSGGVMDRIVSQLLAELDGMSEGQDGSGKVFVIGATNRPDLLDAALLRPGRFDKMLYLGVSDTHEKQLTIMEALTRKFILHPKFSLEEFVKKLPFTYTGADFYALCSDAMLKAVTRQSSLVDYKISEINATNVKSGKKKISTAYYFDHFATEEDLAVTVTEEDFCAAERELIPSVSVKELENYLRVQSQFEKVEENGFDNQRRDKGKGYQEE